MYTRADLESYLRDKWKNEGVDLSDRKRMGISIQELARTSARRSARIRTPHLDIWVGFLDEFISWKVSLLACVWEKMRTGQKATNFDKSMIMLLSKIIADSMSLRHLILKGFDVSAQSLLRSTAEYMEVFVAILGDPSIADEFSKTVTPEAANDFWNKHLTRGGLRKKVRSAWGEIFKDSKDQDAAEWFANWGNSYQKRLSALLHPSFAGGMFTAIPFKSRYKNESWLGAWGDKSEGSCRTIEIYMTYAFPMVMLGREYPFGGYDKFMSDGCVKYNSDDHLHKHVKVGRNILASLVLSIFLPNNEHLFPKIDLSIWPE